MNKGKDECMARFLCKESQVMYMVYCQANTSMKVLGNSETILYWIPFYNIQIRLHKNTKNYFKKYYWTCSIKLHVRY